MCLTGFMKFRPSIFFKILRKQSVIDGWKAETRINGRENSIPPLKLHFKLQWSGVPDATYQVWWKPARRFWRPVLEKIFSGFYHIWAWRPSWSCDQDPANKLSFPLPKDAPHKIWLSSAMQFQRRRCLKFSHVTYVSKIYLDVK